jgi:hypothetical protein
MSPATGWRGRWPWPEGSASSPARGSTACTPVSCRMGTGARWASEQFPDAAIAERLLSRYFKPEGRGGKPYRNLHKRIIDPRTDRQREGPADLQELAVVSAFAEVMRAKHHHDGVVGINVLRKIAMPIPATIYGAMLAGVDVVLTGAGSPDEMPRLLDALARHDEGVLSVKVLRAPSRAEHATRFAPAHVAGLPIGAPLGRPPFLAKRFPSTRHCGVGRPHGSPRCSFRLEGGVSFDAHWVIASDDVHASRAAGRRADASPSGSEREPLAGRHARRSS